jgi:hypothetical protein
MKQILQGNKFFSISQSDNLKVDKVIITHYGVSKPHYNYMNADKSVSTGVAVRFQSPPATRGNTLQNPNDFLWVISQ